MGNFLNKIFKKLNPFNYKKVKSYFENNLEKVSNSTFLTFLYYGFINKSFKRELSSTLKGRLHHTRLIKEKKANEYLLTRNIHRIEKGLIMKPRKEIFALDYIDETMDAFLSLLKSNELDKNIPKHKWFNDVLNEYFSSIISHPKTDAYKEKLKEFDFTFGNSENPSTPQKRKETLHSNITFEEFSKLSRQRKSVRWFKDKKIPRELIDKAILTAIQAPSACNRQPFEYYVIDSEDLLKKAVEIPMGTKGYSQTIPMFIVVVGDLSAYFSERDRHLIYIDASLANMAFLFALETMGLSSCSINWPDIEEKEIQMKRLLNLKKYQRPIMCIAVGYGDEDGGVPFSEKKSIESIRKYL